MNKSKSRASLTNEYMSKNFTDNFTLALTAMDCARYFIESGREFTLASLLDHVAKVSAHEKAAGLDEKSKSDES
jgi:hypothetical protein